MFACICNKLTEKQWQDATEEACKRNAVFREEGVNDPVWAILEKESRCGRCASFLEDKTRHIIKIAPV